MMHTQSISDLVERSAIADTNSRRGANCRHRPAAKFSAESDAVSEDINVLALVKGQERYIFLYDDKNRSQALRVLGRYASNPELSFSWYDAAVLSQKIRRTPPANSASARFKLPQASENNWKNEDSGF